MINHLHAVMFILLRDLYLDFVDVYPNSSYRLDAERMYVESLNLLTKFAEQKK